MSLAQRCSHQFSAQTRQRGQGCFSGGHVDLSVIGSIAAAYVHGSGENVYDVDLEWGEKANSLFAGCSCPHFQDGFLCKHLWATLLAVDNEGFGDEVPGSGRVQIADFEDDWEDDENLVAGLDGGLLTYVKRMLGDAGAIISPAIRSKKTKTKKAAVPLWQRQLNALRTEDSTSGQDNAWQSFTAKQRIVWYVLDIGASAAQGQPWIDLYQRETKRNGEFGKVKRLSIRPQEIDRLSDPEDCELLKLLLSIQRDDDDYPQSPYRSSYNYSPSVSGFAVPLPLLEVIFPRLCATGRLVWVLGDPETPDVERQLSWDDGPSDQKRPVTVRQSVPADQRGPSARHDRHAGGKPFGRIVVAV